MIKDYLESTKKQFEYYKSLGEKAFSRLSEEQLFWQFNTESNSVVSIVKHLSGNMLSRWTDFLTSDGEKEWRDRDGEFENNLTSRAEMLEIWEKGWGCLFEAMSTIREENFHSKVYIRGEELSIMEALNRQLAHYPYHVGQIVYLAKMMLDDKWQSLTIPKGFSKNFNQEMINLKNK